MSLDGHNDVKRVQEATDLVRLVGEHVRLKPAGREMVGLCPFHNDKAPSMRVSPQKQIFKCFACGAGGDCFSFMMKYHRMEFREALTKLAERAGIALTPFRGQKAGDGDDAAAARKALSEANDKALAFFRRTLADAKAGAAGAAYVAKRGITPEMAETFQLGIAPDQWDALALAIAARKADPRPYVDAGLIAPSSRGGHMDKLRHRLIFPIHDELGRVVAFGGRLLPDSQREEKSDAKYLNSPETALFHKSSTLYGLWQAKKSIMDAKTAIVVEGYMDVIACHQRGVTNVVAALGTAFTPQHAEKLRRYCDRVVFLFDGDAAGQKAADRAAGVMFEEFARLVILSKDLDISIAVLSGGEGAKDPDEILSGHDGRAKFDALIANAEDAMTFLFKKVTAEVKASGSTTGQTRVLEDFLARLARSGFNPSQLGGFQLQKIENQLAFLTGLSRSEIGSQLSRLAKQHATTQERRTVDRQAGTVAPKTGTVQDADPDDWRHHAAEASTVISRDEPSIGRVTAGRLMAERQLIAAVLADPRVLAIAVPGGASLDEAVPPGLVSIENREAWAWVLRRLADGSLPGTPAISLLEQERREDLKHVVMRADEALELVGSPVGPALERVVKDAVAAILKFARPDDRRQELLRKAKDA